jgi:thiamine-monophosphate kinase
VKSLPMDEFELIDRLIAALGDQARGPGMLLGPGDDAALLEIPPHNVLVSSIDTLVAGTHFPMAAPADLIGQRAMGVSLSDLAAMGADADYVLIAVTLPDGSADWVGQFAHGIASAAQRFEVRVAGGNLARGPLNVTVSVNGHIVPGDALRRGGARVGDLVCVSGLLGGAAIALSRSDLLQPGDAAALLDCESNDECYPLRRYYLPEPRLALGRALRGVATAAIDVSDGLVADLGHLCRASGVAATIDLDAVPAAPGCTQRRAAVSGDDYELCFTIPPEQRESLNAMPTPITVIGRIERGSGVTITSDGQPVALAQGGFRHFS